MQFINDERDALMIHWNTDLGYEILKNHLLERYKHFMKDFNTGDFVHHYFQMALLIFLTLPGKFTIMSPVFTASTPGLVTADLILI